MYILVYTPGSSTAFIRAGLFVFLTKYPQNTLVGTSINFFFSFGGGMGFGEGIGETNGRSGYWEMFSSHESFDPNSG